MLIRVKVQDGLDDGRGADWLEQVKPENTGRAARMTAGRAARLTPGGKAGTLEIDKLLQC